MSIVALLFPPSTRPTSDREAYTNEVKKEKRKASKDHELLL
jgi:hypothetical protein